jgi:hypothetical protein
VPLECWLIAGVLYVALVAVARLADVRELLGFPRTLDGRAVESDAVIDIGNGTPLAPLGGMAAPAMEPAD